MEQKVWTSQTLFYLHVDTILMFTVFSNVQRSLVAKDKDHTCHTMMKKMLFLKS